MNKEDNTMFQQAVKRCRAVEARATINPATKVMAIVRCFDIKGREVALWCPGVSKKLNILDPPRKWAPKNKRQMDIVAKAGKKHANV